MANTQVIHGGRAGREALTTGEEFTGPAKEAELAVREELATDGRLALVLRGAIRLQAVADLYFTALIDAGERNDQVRLNSYVKTFTYIQSKALLVLSARSACAIICLISLPVTLSSFAILHPLLDYKWLRIYLFP